MEESNVIEPRIRIIIILASVSFTHLMGSVLWFSSTLVDPTLFIYFISSNMLLLLVTLTSVLITRVIFLFSLVSIVLAYFIFSLIYIFNLLNNDLLEKGLLSSSAINISIVYIVLICSIACIYYWIKRGKYLMDINSLTRVGVINTESNSFDPDLIFVKLGIVKAVTSQADIIKVINNIYTRIITIMALTISILSFLSINAAFFILFIFAINIIPLFTCGMAQALIVVALSIRYKMRYGNDLHII